MGVSKGVQNIRMLKAKSKRTRPSPSKKLQKVVNLQDLAVFEKRLTAGPTDGPTDRLTKPFIKLLFATENGGIWLLILRGAQSLGCDNAQGLGNLVSDTESHSLVNWPFHNFKFSSFTFSV